MLSFGTSPIVAALSNEARTVRAPERPAEREPAELLPDALSPPFG
jgi:hypothetical protein